MLNLVLVTNETAIQDDDHVRQESLSSKIVTRLDSDQPVRSILGTSKSAIYDDEQIRQVNLSSRIVTKSDMKHLSLKVVTRLDMDQLARFLLVNSIQRVTATNIFATPEFA